MAVPAVYAQRQRILVVAKDDPLREALTDTLENGGNYLTSQASSFDEALGEILIGDFTLVITEASLPDLSGMDLLAVVGKLRPGVRVILIDDDLSAKSAVAAFRLGAASYLYKPVNLEFVLMQIGRELSGKKPLEALPPQEEKIKRRTFCDRERRLNPNTRPAALALGRQQFSRIATELETLHTQVKAAFVGLVDVDGNMVGAAGTLGDYDLMLLTRALTIDNGGTKSLAAVLEENNFHSTYFEGEHSGVYIIEFGQPYLVSLAVICSVEAKAGTVWLYSKRAASAIGEILATIRRPTLTF